MNYPGLIGIGRLGGRDAEGFHHVMIKPDYRSVFSGLEEVYLIFNSDRVFYVTISDRKQSERKIWVKFLEDGIAEEQKLHREVVLAIADEAVAEADSELDAMLGWTAVHDSQLLGTVEDYFYNGAQQVLQIMDNNGVEYLIPYVDNYVSAVLHSTKSILLQNAGELIALYKTEANK